MTYAAASAMRRSPSLKGRVESSAYAHGQSMQWVDRNLPVLVATPDWVTAWTNAYADAINDGDVDRDIGISVNVITDAMIDTAVQQLVDQQAADAAAAKSATDQEIADLKQQVADLTEQVASLAQSQPVSGDEATAGA